MKARAASSTAVLVCQGRAVADGRHAVGVFTDPVARELLDPEERRAVDLVRAGTPVEAADRLAQGLLRRTALVVVPRTVAIDTAVREQGARQAVILGAGLDTRAWRMPELVDVTVFEVDHPASQRDKLRRVAGRAPRASSVVPVEVDLATRLLGPALESAGFDRESVSAWVWEGVVPYLRIADVRAAVAQVADLSAPGSRLVINYQARSAWAGIMRRAMRLVLWLTRQADPFAAEPWRSLWSPSTMRGLLERHGFDVATDDDLLTLAAGLALPHDADGSLRNGRVVVAIRR